MGEEGQRSHQEASHPKTAKLLVEYLGFTSSPPSTHRLLYRLLLKLHEQTAGTLAHGPATPSVARLCHLQH